MDSSGDLSSMLGEVAAVTSVVFLLDEVAAGLPFELPGISMDMTRSNMHDYEHPYLHFDYP